MRKSVEYRSFARECLKNNWGTAILVCLITFGISALVGMIPVVGTIASLLLAGPLVVAELIYFVKLNRKEEATVGTMFTNFGKELINNFLTYLLQAIFTVLWTLLFLIPGIIKTYSYAMTMYLRVKNPQLKATEAITLSRKIMDGKKWDLFCLHLSFIGWAILSVLTFGIGFIFLLPYMQASQTAFYEDAFSQYQQSGEPVVEISNEESAE